MAIIPGATTSPADGELMGASAGVNEWLAIVPEPIVAKSAAYTIANTDGVILCNAAGGAFTLTLPAASASKGQRITLIKTDAAANAVSVAPNGTDNINGSNTTQTGLAASSQWSTKRLLSDGTAWYLV